MLVPQAMAGAVAEAVMAWEDSLATVSASNRLATSGNAAVEGSEASMHNEKHDRLARLAVHGGAKWRQLPGVGHLAAVAVNVALDVTGAPDLQPAPGGINHHSSTITPRRRRRGRHQARSTSPVLIGARSRQDCLASAADCASRMRRCFVLCDPLPPAPWRVSIETRVSVYHCVGKCARWPALRRAIPDTGVIRRIFTRFGVGAMESGRVLNEAHCAVWIAYRRCPILLLASELDDAVPLAS
jgi:hypothetical protein